MRYLFVILLLLPSLAFSAVSITNVGGTISDGQTLTITGSGFGTRADNGGAASYLPRMWDDFEDQNFTGWTLTVDGSSWSVVSSNARTGSTYSAHKASATALDRMQISPTGGMSNYYTSFWFYMASDYTGAGNDKFFRMGESGGETNAVWGNAQSTIEFTGCSGTTQVDYHTLPSVGVWHFVEVETYVGASDWLRVWVDGALDGDFPTGTCTDVWATPWDNAPYISYGTWFDSNIQSGWNYDDIYIDYTLARAFIGNASTFSGSTHREMFIPTSWTDTEIQGTFNQGSFANASTVYLYVVDSTGAYNTTGYPITIGGTVNTSPSVSITTPTSSATYSTSTAAITVSGTASDSDGTVASMTWACPTCTPTSGTATGTTSWTFDATLASGSNSITVTAHDDQSATGSDTLTATYTPPGSITCYLDADGDGYGVGTSETVSTCSANYYEAANLTATSGDCNDSDPLVYPGHECGGQAIYSPTRFAPLTVSGWMSQ